MNNFSSQTVAEALRLKVNPYVAIILDTDSCDSLPFEVKVNRLEFLRKESSNYPQAVHLFSDAIRKYELLLSDVII